MRFLLDTHVLLWAASDPDRLSSEARTILENGGHSVFVSVVSAWEIAVKQSLGKLDLPKPAEIWLPLVLRRTGFEVSELSLGAALRVRGMPWHHRDPFDRLLAAHALETDSWLMTADAAFDAYGVRVVHA